MKLLLFAILLTLLASCNPTGFDYKENPAWVLNTAFKAVENLDQESFLEVSGKEALCLYGNPNGITYLKENIEIDKNQIKAKHVRLESKHFRTPEFVGFWSYYKELYKIDFLDKHSNKMLIQAVVECNFGTNLQKDEQLKNLRPKHYKMKVCKIIKILPQSFTALPLSERCKVLAVTL